MVIVVLTATVPPVGEVMLTVGGVVSTATGVVIVTAVACADKADNLRSILEGYQEKGSQFLSSFQTKMKDKVENYLHDQVCSGAMPLQEAQTEIATNWLAVYNRMPQT